ncbi:unnamed protein product [Camellia sinensis]
MSQTFENQYLTNREPPNQNLIPLLLPLLSLSKNYQTHHKIEANPLSLSKNYQTHHKIEAFLQLPLLLPLFSLSKNYQIHHEIEANPTWVIQLTLTNNINHPDSLPT